MIFTQDIYKNNSNDLYMLFKKKKSFKLNK